MTKKKNLRQLAVFLDRDGTINHDYGYVSKFSNFKFRPHVIKGLKYLSKKKYLIFIVTNQAGLAKGLGVAEAFTTMIDKLKPRKQVKKGASFHPSHLDDDYDPLGTL